MIRNVHFIGIYLLDSGTFLHEIAFLCAQAICYFPYELLNQISVFFSFTYIHNHNTIEIAFESLSSRCAYHFHRANFYVHCTFGQNSLYKNLYV